MARPIRFYLPPGIPKIDRSHPLAYGLVFSPWLSGNVIYDITGNCPPLTLGNAGVPTVSTYGAAVAGDGIFSGLYQKSYCPIKGSMLTIASVFGSQPKNVTDSTPLYIGNSAGTGFGSNLYCGPSFTFAAHPICHVFTPNNTAAGPVDNTITQPASATVVLAITSDLVTTLQNQLFYNGALNSVKTGLAADTFTNAGYNYVAVGCRIQAPTTFTCTGSAVSKTLTTVSPSPTSASVSFINQQVTGANIPALTYVTNQASSTLTLNNNPTGVVTSVTTTGAVANLLGSFNDGAIWNRVCSAQEMFEYYVDPNCFKLYPGDPGY